MWHLSNLVYEYVFSFFVYIMLARKLKTEILSFYFGFVYLYNLLRISNPTWKAQKRHTYVDMSLDITSYVVKPLKEIEDPGQLYVTF